MEFGKPIGICRHIDSLGRIVIPKEIATNLKLNTGNLGAKVIMNGIFIYIDAGASRRMDDLGRFVVPVKIRKELKWEINTLLEMFSYENGVFIKAKHV